MKKVLVLLCGIVISLCGLVFSACENNYDNVNVIPSQNEISIAIGETKTFSVELQNMPKGMSSEIQINNTNNIIKVLNKEITNNKIIVEVKANKVGQTIAEVKTFEGDKTCNVKFEVFEKISGFELKTSPYVLKQENYQIDLETADYFSFSPSNCKVEKIIYSYNNEVITGIKTAKIGDTNTFQILLETATTPITLANDIVSFKLNAKVENYELTKEVNFDIITPINSGNINIIKKGLGTDYLSTDPESTTPIQIVNDNAKVILVSNDTQNFYNEFEFECETPNTENSQIVLDIIGQNDICITNIISKSDLYTSTFDYSKYFSVQSNKVGNTKLVVKLYYSNYPSYVITKNINIEVIASPISVNANGILYEDSSPVILYDYNTINSGTYNFNINVLDQNSTFDSVTVSVVESKIANTTIENFNEFLDLYYKENKTESFDISKTDFINNTLSTKITLTGKQTHEEIFYIKISVNAFNTLGTVECYIPIIIKKGASNFEIKTEYKQGIYLDLSEGQKDFDGLTITEGAYIGKLSFIYSNNSNTFFEVKQKENNSLILEIIPKNVVGKGDVQIVLANGLSTILRNVNIVHKLIKDETKDINLKYNANSIIADSEKDADNNISKIVVKYIEEDIKNMQNPIQFVLTNCNEFAKLYTINVSSSDNTVVTIEESLKLTLKSIGTATLTITINLEEIENFKKQNGQTIVFEVEVVTYSPISTLDIMQNNVSCNSISIYAKKEIGYYYSEVSNFLNKTMFSLKVNKFDGSVIDNPLIENNISFSWRPLGVYSKKDVTEIDPFGNLTIDKNKNELTLICDNASVQTDTTMLLSFTLTEYNQVYTKTLIVNILHFEKLDWIGIENYQNIVYLSSINNSHTFNAILDINADKKDFDVFFYKETKDNTTGKVEYAQKDGVLNILVNKQVITVSPISDNMSGVRGQIRFIPKTAYTAENIYYYYLSVDIMYSDGTEEFPEIISTTQDFENAVINDLTKHYLIINTLDFNNYLFSEDFYNAERNLSGSIKGANSSAKLVNLNITNSFKHSISNIKYYYGLFSQIESSAKLQNLFIEGSVNITSDSLSTNLENYFIGFIAGINLGQINNVSVSLKTSKININYSVNNTLTKIYIGGIVGQNNGTINTLITLNSFNNNLLINSGEQQITYTGFSKNIYYGGVAGDNAGTISRQVDISKTLFNNNTYSQNVNITTKGFNNVGGICGINNGSIDSQIITGKILANRNNNEYGEIVGAISGENKNSITNCISRAEVGGYNYVGGISGNDLTQNIINCVVQAKNSINYTPLIKALMTQDSVKVGAISGNEEELISIYKIKNNKALYYCNYYEGNTNYPIKYGTNYTVTKLSAMFEKSIASTNVAQIDTTSKISNTNYVNAQILNPTDNTYNKKIVNMLYYETNEQNYQSFVDYLNLNRIIPFDFTDNNAICFVSENTDLLKINNNGTFEIFGTGLAKIKIYSILDETKIDYVYINIINAFDDYVIEYGLNGSQNKLNTTIELYDGEALTLQYRFIQEKIMAYNQDNTLEEVVFYDLNHAPIELTFKDNTDISLSYVYGDIDDVSADDIGKVYSKITMNGNLIIFETLDVDGETRINTLTFSPIYNVELENICEVYMNSNALNSILAPNDSNYIFTVEAKRGTSRIDANFTSIEIQPIDEIKVIVNQITDKENDFLIISSSKANDTTNNKDYFNVINSTNYEFNTNKYVKTNMLQSGEFVFLFNFEKYGQTDYAGTYYITFSSSNNKTKTITINLVQQSLSSIKLHNYYNTNNTFSYTNLEANFVSAGSKNVLVLEVYPYFADYDYITIQNNEQNASLNNTLVMKVYSFNGTVFEYIHEGIVYEPTRIKVYKSAIENLAVSKSLSKIYISYQILSLATVNSEAIINIKAVKLNENVETITYTTAITLTVTIREGASFAIEGKADTDKIYIAKGMTYNLNLSTYGYTEEQVVWEIVDNNGTRKSTDTYGTEVAVSIQKINGEYKLIVTSNSSLLGYSTSQEGFNVLITTYGKNFNHKSGDTYLNLVIVDYVVLTDNIQAFSHSTNNIEEFDKNIAVENSQNAVINISVGNKLTLRNGFVNGVSIEYNPNIKEVVDAVKLFEQSLTNNGSWRIKSDENHIIGAYIKEYVINTASSLSNQYVVIEGSLDTNYNKVLNVIPIKVIDYKNPKYYFNYTGAFKYMNGKATYSADLSVGSYNLSSDFVLQVYANSTEENAVPIYSYKELTEMQANGHYILLEDITLPLDFVPLDLQNTNIRSITSLDGNGHTITFPNSLTFKDGSSYGLFSEISENTIIKNLTIKVQSSVYIETLTKAFMFGHLAGTNNGTITNCEVIGTSFVQELSLNNEDDYQHLDNFVAGLVGENNGFITNSRVLISISTTVTNLAGFVGINNNTIASSYVKNSIITNQNTADITSKTAGFVVLNGESINSSAKITTSFVSGGFSSQTFYYSGDNYCITSSSYASAFVFTNFCDINNCYADIPVLTNVDCSGFVFENAGVIDICYTTSSFGNKVGLLDNIFIRDNIINNTNGIIKNCVFFVGSVNNGASGSNNGYQDIKGLTELNNLTEFSNANNFKNFAISNNLNKTEAVWFYPSNTSESDFAYKGVNANFTYGKPELVAPNIITYSKKELDNYNTKVDAKTGETTYAYIETKEAVGSKFNPILISNSLNFENSITINSYNNINNKYYRIISSIDYIKDKVYNSKLYKTIFTGDLEGNGMEIKNFSINVTENLESAGLFAQIGQGYSSLGVVKNLKLTPSYLGFNDTINAGTLCGTLESGRIFNIDCNGVLTGEMANTETLQILGHNVVGGVIGFATNSYNIVNVSSSISVYATYDHTKTNSKVQLLGASNNKNVSYAGCIAGALMGTGILDNANVYGACSSIGEVAGLMFGKIGKSIIVKNITQTVNQSQKVCAYIYGGIVVGENSGYINNTNIDGTLSLDFFKKSDVKNSLAIAVGGVAGLMSGGEINNAILNNILINFSIASPEIVGGIVGEIIAGSIANSTFKGDIQLCGNSLYYPISKFISGGIIGLCSSEISIITDSKITPDNVTVDKCVSSGNISVNSVNVLEVSIGGLIGQTINKHKLTDSTHSTSAYKYEIKTKTNNNEQEYTSFMNIKVNSTIYDGIYNAYLGGFVGGVFSDNTKNYAGDLVISNSSENILYPDSRSVILLSVNVNGLGGIVNSYYGGILGLGYPVSELRIINDIPDNYASFGQLLTRANTDLLTSSTYIGQYDAENNIIQDFITQQEIVKLLINGTRITSLAGNEVLTIYENNYWEDLNE